ncbi:hypothetical protein H5410_018292 [Solanum commersonii]|uniref:AIPP2-like SPOC-like domain-containing protein n=1 Tax=Solanum commersonii TaxID=4109 RepID=A0A9J6A2Q5_SOLCO|nr:hypothetical protein H5410_018292 [Solanum commersonii]
MVKGGCKYHPQPMMVHNSNSQVPEEFQTISGVFAIYEQRLYCVLGYFVAAPVDWCCDICDTGKRVISSYSEGSKLHASAKICQTTLPPKYRIKFPSGHRKTRYLPVEEALSLSSDIKKYGCPRKKTVSSTVLGSFDISGALEFALRMLNNCIHAHPPSRVRRKVYEFLGVLPHTLKFELVPRGNIWASLFNNHCSGKEDIGLYFFASGREMLASTLNIHL